MAIQHSLAAGVGLLTVLGLTAPTVLAQSTATSDPTAPPVVNPGAGFGTNESSDNPFGGNTNSPFDLIHRAVLMNEMSLSDFSRIHQNRMSTEAANFRTLQQEALRRQQAGLEATDQEANPAIDIMN
ncbi:hypothetical protein GFS31_28060 [Leptolyngbya sp. BL0902]|uniref:hypothetical protein n=1 Tax=Leptolyngbya sp. BL0902 TaxID=1115757 RepID=UPI0018E78490|nr:hypothetical protein [Leptolyngbya sp. BL0902]QQE66109.1 hypothetical protein GFS31_28060 [Leptolyngbya sp. BL0902]